MGLANSTSVEGSSSTGNAWTACLYFHIGNDEWKQLKSHEVIEYFIKELEGEQEIIEFSEIRKYNLWYIPGWCGNWHEYTLVKTTNWHWSFEKNMGGIYVQRSSTRDQVRCQFGCKQRKHKDRTEGRKSEVSFGENIVKVVQWIINRRELNKTYHVFESNCHFFASLLYEAITRTKGERRLSSTW